MKKLKRMLAFLCVAGIVLTEMNISVDTKAVSDIGWSDWSMACPSLPAGYKVETRAVYRYRDKEFTNSANSYMNGWEQYSSTESWGVWSDWQDEEITNLMIVRLPQGIFIVIEKKKLRQVPAVVYMVGHNMILSVLGDPGRIGRIML